MPSSTTHEPTIHPAPLIPQVDLRALAKTTRKTLERLVPFSHMWTSSSETSPSFTKIINKIKHYITLIDSSMLCQQLGYQLAKNCMALCDPEPDVGLNTPGGNTGVATCGRGGDWTPVGVSGQLGAADAYAFGHGNARELAGKGHEIALKVKEGFSDIAQEMYTIEASTKDDMLVVVTPDPNRSENQEIYLKDVGTELVASLSLLSEFSKAVTEVADWWFSVKDDLDLEESALLAVTQYERWSKMKDDFQEYYDVINIMHLRFPELLPSSISAWQSVASAPNQAPSSIGHSEITHRSQNQPVLAGVNVNVSNGHTPIIEWKHGCATLPILEKAGKQNLKKMESAHPATAGRAVYLEADGMWQNGQILRYCFLHTCPGTPYQQNKVKRVIKEWEKYANITFEYVDAQDATIRIIFDQSNGSWSFIGRDVATVPVGEPTMNLAWIGDTEDINDTDTGVILHEFGHALGLGHEHQSPVRGSALKLKEEPTIEFYMRRKGWDEQDVRGQILNVYNKKDVTNHSKLDLESIMVYPMPSAMNEQNQWVKPNNKLSQLDKAHVSINYPREISDKNDTNWTIEYALGVAGVDMGTRERILGNYRSGGLDQLRTIFKEWCVVMRFCPVPGHKSKHGLKLNMSWERTSGRDGATEDLTKLSPGAQAIEDGFRQMQGICGADDPRISYGKMPSSPSRSQRRARIEFFQEN